MPLKDYAYQEARYTMLARSNPDIARELLHEAQDDVERQWRVYSARAAMPGRVETPNIAPLEKTKSCTDCQWKGNGGLTMSALDLTTEYGLTLKNPLVVSSNPLSESVLNVRRMEDYGASAVILASLFEEQLSLESEALDRDLSRGTESYSESLSYLPEFDDYQAGQDKYLEHLIQVKHAVAIPVLASINGATPGGWVQFARDVEAAGADALELNTYSLATDPHVPGSALEKQLIELVREVAKASEFRSRSSCPRSSRASLISPFNSRRLGPMAWYCSIGSTSRTLISRI